MSNQINTQEIIKKDFLNIFEISHLFDVSGITARRHIKSILEKIALLEDKIKLNTQSDQALLTQELVSLNTKVKKKVIGQTRDGQDMYLLELASKEAFANWELRPTIKTVIQETERLSTQDIIQPVQPVSQSSQPITQDDSSGNNQHPESIIQKTSEQNSQPLIVDAFAGKYVQLLETQLSEKDATIKDLRETNKFLSITNGKINEQLRLLLEKPQNPTMPTSN
jgi:hypothetical protein